MRDIRTRLADIAAHLAHHTNVIVAVEEVVFVLPAARSATRAMRRLVRLERGIAEHNDQALRVLVIGRDRGVLLSNKLGQLGWWHRLGPCRRRSRVSMRHVGWAGADVEATMRRVGMKTYLRASWPARESLGTMSSLEKILP